MLLKPGYLKQGVKSASTIDASPQTLVIFGDSITGASSSNSAAGAVGITGLTKANPGAVTKTGHGFSTGDSVYIWGVQGMTQVNNAVFTATSTGANGFTIGADTSAYGTYASGGTAYKSKGAVITYPAQGYVSGLNMLSGQRYAFNHNLNRGIGGNSTTDMNNRKAVDLPGLGATLIVVMGGTNDISASVANSTIQSNLTSILSYITGTLGKKAVLGTVPPRDADTSTQKDARESLNAWIRAQGSTNVKIWDYYDAVTDPASRSWKSGYSYDGIHPSPLGGFFLSQKLEQALTPFYGRSAGFSLNAGNMLINPSLSGTGGTIGSNTTGGVAAGWISETNTASGTKTLGKNGQDKQVMAVNYGSGLSTGERLSLRQSVTSGLSVGTSYVAEAEITLDSFSGTGIWYEANIELRNQSASWAADNGRRSFDTLAIADLVSASGSRALHFKTPAIEYLAGWTELRLRVNMTFRCDTGTAAAQMTVKNAQLYPV